MDRCEKLYAGREPGVASSAEIFAPRPACAGGDGGARVGLVAPIRRRDIRLAKLVRIEHVSDQCATRVRVGIDLVDLERIDRKHEVVRLVTLGRAGAAVAGLAE